MAIVSKTTGSIGGPTSHLVCVYVTGDHPIDTPEWNHTLVISRSSSSSIRVYSRIVLSRSRRKMELTWRMLGGDLVRRANPFYILASY
jgi:hypothetical protein